MSELNTPYHAEDMDTLELRQALANMCNCAYEQGRTDGAREFAEWLIHQDKVIYDPVSKDFYTCDDEHYTIISTLSVDEVLDEWQKGAE